MNEHRDLGRRIRALRKTSLGGLTGEVVASALGISRSHLSMIETGKGAPGRKLLSAIADFFGTSVDYLLNGASDPAQPPAMSEVVNDPDELAWLRLWRSLDDNDRKVALRMLKPRR